MKVPARWMSGVVIALLQAMPVLGAPPPNTELAQPSSPTSDVVRIERLIRTADSVPQRAPEQVLELKESVVSANFISGTDRLTARGAAELDRLAASLQGLRVERALISAHTDSLRLIREARRRYGTNQRLSEARAAAIVQYLQASLNWPDAVFGIRGYGADQPIADNRTAQGRARNRRAQIAVWALTPESAAAQPVASGADSAQPGSSLTPHSECVGAAADQMPPVRITVDGKPVDEREPINEADRQRCVDRALARSSIELRYDPLQQKPLLNVLAAPQQAVPGTPVRFTTYANYPRFIARAEIRLFAADRSIRQEPLAVLPVAIGQQVEWLVPAQGGEQLQVRSSREAAPHLNYVLRVYDAEGHFDETFTRPLDLVTDPGPDTPRVREQRQRELERAVYAENALVLHNIPLAGGSVTVSGSQVPNGDHVNVDGEAVPVDDQQRFVAQQIVPRGPQQVTVEVLNAQGEGLQFTRNVSIAVDDSFFVALADFTAGHQSTSGPIELVSGDETLARHDYVDGHLAFYYKGLVRGDWLLTAAADSQGQPVRDLFSNFSSKDGAELFRRIDPNRYYPVYGDDSTTVQDAPTSGKFYVRIERGEDAVIWGNFHTELTGTDFFQYSRTLYGLDMRYRSEQTTSAGEKVRSADAFWANPGTVGAREEFRGTGGSVYYLHNQDVSVGSEQVWIETRDRDSGIVSSVRQLVPAQDYDVNYMQGRILLHEPLETTANSATVVHSGGLDGDPVYLVVTYEYVPGFTNPDSNAFGGHASEWISDHINIGASDYHQGDQGAGQDLKGVNATVRYQPGTYVSAEFAHSDGAGTPTLSSVTGGLSFDTLASNGQGANAERIEAAADLKQLSDGLQGKVSAYYQDRQANFSGPGQITPGVAAVQDGAAVSTALNATTQLVGKFDSTASELSTVRSGELGVDHRLDEHWHVAVGARMDDREGVAVSNSAILSQTGDRTDAAVSVGYVSVPASGPASTMRSVYSPSAGWSAYAFAQDTLERTGSRPDNDRGGVGGSVPLTNVWRLGGEVSDGSLGFGAKVSTDYHVSPQSNLYLNYTLAADQPDALNVGREGLLTSGTRYRYDDSTSVYAEERVQSGSGPDGLVQAYGVDFSPDQHWKFGMKLEQGTLADPVAGDIAVHAVAGNLGYTATTLKYSGGLEWREDDSSVNGASHTVLARNSLTYQLLPPLKLLGTLNWSQTSAEQGSTLNAAYHEIVLGAAWRPVNDDRWNTLMKATILVDEPSAAQIATTGNTIAYAQQSRLFDIDSNYQVLGWLSLGIKYAIRTGELKATDSPGTWFPSTAQLWILRTDLLPFRQWDAMLELRRLEQRDTEDARSGVLAGIYRRMGSHLKIGAGFNFTNYSDNLSDVSYRSRGFFLNTVAVF